jgi:ADP-ribose pyrophosphatase YjhB (NUDIX family)
MKNTILEYSWENGKPVDVDKLQSPKMEKKDYSNAHASLCIPCHDVFIQYDEGILLVVRDNLPLKGELWPIGGRIERGMKTEDSLRKKVREESGLELEEIKFLGVARTFLATSPFEHGKGTDTLSLTFFAKGKGKITLDKLHKNPKIINLKEYKKIKNELHPYVREFMEKAFNS